MALNLQAVKDAPADQNFQAIAKLFPLGKQHLANESVGADQLDGDAKELFLQLATVGNRKVNFGEGTLGNSGSPTTNLEVTHGLGTTPVAALATCVNRDINIACHTLGATKFTVEGRDITGVNISSTNKFFWIAIG